MPVDESHLMKTIVVGADWEDVLSHIIEEENINPWDVDIIKLVDAFMNYLQNLKSFDFRIPARFVLIAAILLSLKCETLTVRATKEREEKIPEININVPLLDMPIVRIPKRKVTISDLIGALSKAVDFEERKKERKLVVRRAVENLIQPTEDIEVRIERVFDEIKNKNITKFSDLVGKWDRKDIVEKFLPMLHLSTSGRIRCDQAEIFGEIFISLDLEKPAEGFENSENNAEVVIEK